MPAFMVMIVKLHQTNRTRVLYRATCHLVRMYYSGHMQSGFLYTQAMIWRVDSEIRAG
jgi:hypothetical protein